MGRRRPLALLALGIMAWGPSGCSDTQSLRPGRTLQVALTEYRLVPQSVRVSAGELTIVAHNYGRLTHNLVVTRGTETTGETKPIPPGHSAELALAVSPGKYLMASTMLADQALGEYGTLIVGG